MKLRRELPGVWATGRDSSGVVTVYQRRAVLANIANERLGTTNPSSEPSSKVAFL